MKRIDTGLILRQAGVVLIPLGLAVLILTLRNPFPLRPLAIAARYSFTAVLPVVALGSYLALRLAGAQRESWWARMLALSWVSVLFALAVAGLWAACQSDDQALGGLLPWNDSINYYTDALRLLDGRDFSAVSARRPLVVTLFSVLLLLSGRNFQASLAVMAGLNALACYLAVREVQRTHGPLVASFVLTLVFFFARRYAGTLTTESLGLTLGLLGFALLWRGAAQPRSGQALLGLLTLSVASNVRPGALFVLPLVALWAAWLWRGARRFFSWKVLGLGALAIAAGFAAQTVVFKLTSPPKAASFSNMPYLLYGVSVGGKGWTQYRVDHPEVLALSEAERSNLVMQYTLAEMKAHPGNFLAGSLKQYAALFSNSYYNLYAFLNWDNGWLSRGIWYILYALCLAGAFAWLRRRRDPYLLLVMAFLAGTFLSVPFAPPMDANRMRLYAATIIVFTLLPALGLQTVVERLRWNWLSGQPAPLPLPGRLLPAFSLLLMALTVLPALLGLFPRSYVLPTLDCGPEQTAAYLRYDPGAALQIITESTFYLDWVPVVHKGRFDLSLHNTGNISTIQEFETLEAPVTLLVGPNLQNGTTVWLAAPADQMPAEYGVLGVCGQRRPGERILRATKVIRLPGW